MSGGHIPRSQAHMLAICYLLRGTSQLFVHMVESAAIFRLTRMQPFCM
jgi:hypothetical protein